MRIRNPPLGVRVMATPGKLRTLCTRPAGVGASPTGDLGTHPPRVTKVTPHVRMPATCASEMRERLNDMVPPGLLAVLGWSFLLPVEERNRVPKRLTRGLPDVRVAPMLGAPAPRREVWRPHHRRSPVS